MRRELKFKIWNANKKIMMHEDGIHLLGETVICGEIFRMPDDSSESLDHIGDLIPLQFTGLKDKYGNEIYESDILGYGDNYPCVVEWNNEEARYEAVENSPTNEKYYPRRHDLNYQTVPWLRLGSIYDSPELIKK